MIRNKKSVAWSNPPGYIPRELTSFVGRATEIADVKRLLNTNRVVTLTGTGGCGKTRIALHLASELGEDYSDGVYWIGLASLTQGIHLPQTITKVLDIPQDARLSSDEVLVDALQEKQILLILDNCEHLLEACVSLVTQLLDGTQINIMTTSREALRVTGETVYPLQPMTVPLDENAASGQFDAVKLFVERARSIVPEFELSESNAKPIARICQRLDGIPLAIELASARTSILSVEQIADRLDKCFELLPNNSHLITSPHIGLHAAIDWSYDLLSAKEQLLFQRLSVFHGGCTISIVERVCADNGIEPYEVLDLISSLVNKSLLVAKTFGVNEARYFLLETIREYASEKLDSFSEREEIYRKHLKIYLALTAEVESKLQGEYQQLWLNWIEHEFNNIRAALRFALQSDLAEIGLRIVNAIYQFWTIRDYSEEGLYWYENLLSKLGGEISPIVHAKALSYAANMSGFRGDIKRLVTYGRKATSIAESAGEKGREVLAWALAAQAYGARAEGNFQTEFELANRAIQLHRETGDQYLLAVSLSIWSFSAMSVGKYDVAHAMLDEALPMLRQMENPYRIAMALNFSGDLARCEKSYHEARVVYEESIAMLREINGVRDLASVLHNLGHIYLHLGDMETASTLFVESMQTHESQNNRAGMAECLLGFAALAILQRKESTGIRLLSAVLGIRNQPATVLWAATRMDFDYYLSIAKAKLSTEEFEREQAIGHKLSLEQAIVYAHQVADRTFASTRASNELAELTERELEIVILVAQAKSNGEIADELVLSKRTVEKHIANIRSKLGFSKRTEIVRFAIDNNLLQSDS